MTPGPGGPRRRLRGLVALAVGSAAVVGLGVGAVHAVRATAAQAGASSVAQARLDDAYYRCLATQAHSLVKPGQAVVVSSADPGPWATLSKAVAPWAVMTGNPRRAVAVLSLRTRSGPGACLGTVVVARYPDGTVVRGTGASLPGSGPPPPPVL